MTIQSEKESRWDVEVGGVLREGVFLISPQWCQGPNASDPWQWQSLVQVRLRESLSCKVFLWPNLSVYKWSTKMQNLAATAFSSELPAAWDCSSAETCYWHPLNHLQKKRAEFPGWRDISPQGPQSTPSQLLYTRVCVAIFPSFPVTPVNSVPEQWRAWQRG